MNLASSNISTQGPCEDVNSRHNQWYNNVQSWYSLQGTRCFPNVCRVWCWSLYDMRPPLLRLLLRLALLILYHHQGFKAKTQYNIYEVEGNRIWFVWIYQRRTLLWFIEVITTKCLQVSIIFPLPFSKRYQAEHNRM